MIYYSSRHVRIVQYEKGCAIMAVLLFVDESGHDLKASPYEVLAGISISDCQLWNFVQAAKSVELDCFGCRYSGNGREFKGKKLLKRKTFRLAAQEPLFDHGERRRLASECSTQPEMAGHEHLSALAQAKLRFVEKILELAARFEIKAYASIVADNSPRPKRDILRKDYSYLFQRFCYYLEDNYEQEMGIVVFDELDKAQSHILLNQMSRYFLETATGQARASRIIPEPFFVHSDLTTGVQIADLVAYITSWAVRFNKEMNAPIREELSPYAQQVMRLRHRAERSASLFGFEDFEEGSFGIWSFAWIPDLRPKNERA
jgi:uncharacterized protein DUF3800